MENHSDRTSLQNWPRYKNKSYQEGCQETYIIKGAAGISGKYGHSLHVSSSCVSIIFQIIGMLSLQENTLN